jgi:hypothetical protein
MEQKQITGRPNDNIWKIGLAVVCIGILIYGFFYSKNTTTNFVYLLSYNLPIAALLWFFYYLIFARKSGAKAVGFSFLVIFISLIASALIGFTQQKQNAKRALTEMQDQYSTLMDSITDSQGQPQRIEKRIDTTPKSRGVFGEMEKSIKGFMGQMASQRNDYLLELEAIGWNSVLDPKKIRLNGRLDESKVTIQKAKKIVVKYREKTDVLLQDFREKLQSLNMSASLKQEALSGFDRGMEKSKDEIGAMWSLELSIVKEMEKIINLLVKTNGAWVVKKNQILFYDENDLNRFNAYLASIKSLVKKQQQLQKKSVETVNRNFNRLKDM